MLTGDRWFGFTVFGFWLPLFFWVTYGLFFDTQKAWKDGLWLGVLSVFFTVDITQPEHVFGLVILGFFMLVPIWFVTVRGEARYLQVGFVTYFSALVADITGVPVMSLHTGWLPILLATQPYQANWAHYQTLGGMGLLDGLVIAPCITMLMVWIARKDWALFFGGLSGR